MGEADGAQSICKKSLCKACLTPPRRESRYTSDGSLKTRRDGKTVLGHQRQHKSIRELTHTVRSAIVRVVTTVKVMAFFVTVMGLWWLGLGGYGVKVGSCACS